jgi:EpsI family protein
MSSARFWVVIALMSCAVAGLYRRGDKDRTPSSMPLTSFPEQLGRRVGTDIAIDQSVLDILGQGFFLNRIYSPQPGAGAPANPADMGSVALFIAYFPTQRTGQSIHSPQNCLPGAGWVFDSSGVTAITDAEGKTSQVGDYLISNGNARDEVLYWYQSHGRAIASDYKAKLYMLTDSIRYSRSDAALVRVVVPIANGESRTQAHARAVEFVQQLMPLLPAYIPN